MRSGQPYADRREAGQILAAYMREQFDVADPVVLALPRGGVPVGFEVARAFDAPLDVFIPFGSDTPKLASAWLGERLGDGKSLHP